MRKEKNINQTTIKKKLEEEMNGKVYINDQELLQTQKNVFLIKIKIIQKKLNYLLK